MRGFVLVLLLLAAAKVGYQQHAVSTAKTELIVAAYRDKAADACERASRLNRLEPQAPWAKSGDVRLVIGKGSPDLALWQADNAFWSARYTTPYLFLSMPADARKVHCEFDIVQGVASVYRM